MSTWQRTFAASVSYIVYIAFPFFSVFVCWFRWPHVLHHYLSQLQFNKWKCRILFILSDVVHFINSCVFASFISAYKLLNITEKHSFLFMLSAELICFSFFSISFTWLRIGEMRFNGSESKSCKKLSMKINEKTLQIRNQNKNNNHWFRRRVWFLLHLDCVTALRIKYHGAKRTHKRIHE